MPITKETVPAALTWWTWRTFSDNILTCYTSPEVITSSWWGPYDSYYKQFNDVEHRVKPDPLTDTAQALQFTRRIRPSEIAPFIDYSQSAYCNGTYGTVSYLKQMKHTAMESTSIFEETDWNQKTIQSVGKEFVNLASSVAEYRETGRMFVDWAGSIRKAWRSYYDIKRVRLSRRKITPCSVVAAELAYSFGVRPLTEDLFSAVESLRLKLESPVVVSHHAQSRSNTTRDVRSTPTSLSDESYAIEKEMVSDRVKLRLILEPLATSNILFGSPKQWVWELIPFSFVVDWGIPIGQWLEDVDMLKKIQHVSGTRTRKVQKVRYYKVRMQRQSGAWYTNASLGKTTYKSHQRFLVNSLSFPRLPRWSPSATYHRVYRAVSLLIAVNQPCRKYSGRVRRRST